MSDVCVYIGEALGRYGFGEGHPFGPDRLTAFSNEFDRRGLAARTRVVAPVAADVADLARFHSQQYLERLAEMSETGWGLLDGGDTPAFPGILEASLQVAGSVLDAVKRLMTGSCRRALVPIAGLHHARRGGAAGFCAVNDVGIAIETLKQVYGLNRLAYVDIDAHHGDGVFYSFEDDPAVITVDFHEDGAYLYPGTGHVSETGKGEARGRKLNVPLPPYADDDLFLELWPRAERFLEQFAPQFIIMQAGADSLSGDPITHLQFTSKVHAHTASALCGIADRYAEGRFLVVGGGGYNRANLATAWNDIVERLITD